MRPLHRHHVVGRASSLLPGVISDNLPRRHEVLYSTNSAAGPRYRHIDDIERLDYYGPGGFHPIQIGDCFQTRYRIVHKLGYGSYSTIWLARDQQFSAFVAVKVGTAASYHKEIDTLTQLARHSSQRNGFSRDLIPSVSDRFDVHGPNGTHPCLVTNPATCTLADAIAAGSYEPFQTDVARSISAQLAVAVAHLHDAGFVHGDLHFGNILLRMLTEMSCLTDQQLYSRYGHPETEPVVREDAQPLPLTGVPTHVYPPLWMGKSSSEILLRESRLLLVDYGTSFCPSQESRFESYTPLQISPPEARFEPTTPLSFASDVWSLGCIIWAILGVKPFLGSWLFGPDSAVKSQMDALGPMPDEWWKNWSGKTKTESFEDNGKAKEGREVWTFEQRFEQSIQQPRREDDMEVIGPEEQKAFFQMIKGMLKFSPGDRLSAQQVLDTPWMRKWALVEAKKSWGA